MYRLALLVTYCFLFAEAEATILKNHFSNQTSITKTNSNFDSYICKPLPFFFRFKRHASNRNTKITAACLAVALGPFGMHRLYLGTATHVPVVYVLTIGGGVGLLPLIDLIAILSAKDLEPYINNPKVFMWIK